MSDDVLRLFEGLSPSQAKELRRRIVPALERLRREVIGEDMTTETDEIEQLQAKIEQLQSKLEILEGWGFERPSLKKPPEPPAFDVEAAERRLERLAAEHEALFVEPSRNLSRMQDIQDEMRKLRGQIAKEHERHEAERRESFAEELGQIERDIRALTAESERLMNNPSANHRAILEASDKIAARVNRRGDILSGKIEKPLEWRGDDE